MSAPIRTFGDPVLKSKAAPVADIDGKAMRLVDEMFESLYDVRQRSGARGTADRRAEAGRRLGPRRRSAGDLQPRDRRRPTANGSTRRDACRSPGCTSRWPARRPCSCAGIDLDGNPIEREADELEARMFQHELDHLNGVLMFDRMTPDQRRDAMAEYRRISEQNAPPPPRTARFAACACADRDVTCGRAPGVPRHTRGGGTAAAGAPSRRSRHRPRRHPARPSPRPRWIDVTEPGQGGGARARPPSHRPRRRRARHRRRARRRGGVRSVDPPHVLAAVPMINMHFSLLPRWRGAAPVERAMLAGDAVTGVCIMDVADELDAGDIYARRRCRSGTRRRPTSCAPASSTSAPSCSSTPRRRPAATGSAAGR